jgi:hypothetical protein
MSLSQLGHNISEPTCVMLLLLNVASKQQTSIPYICLCKDLGSNPRVTEHEAHAMKKIYNYKTIICTYFYFKCISHVDKLMVIREANLCLIYVICVSLRIVVSNTYCVVFLFCFSSSCVLYVTSFSRLCCVFVLFLFILCTLCCQFL